ncbi:MAG: guanine deaminase [Gemmatimonadota bacterium]
MPSVLLRGPVLTPLPDGRAAAWEDGRVEIGADGRLLAVGAWPQGPDDGIADARRAVQTGRALILPAFVDAHVHLPQLDVRGRYGLPLLPWLDRYVFPAELAFSDPELAARTAERFFAALAGAGIGTAAVFATVHAKATGRAFEQAAASGLRVIMGKVLMDRRAPAALCELAEEGLRASLALAETWEGAAGGRLHYALTPRFAPGCSPEMLAATGAAARSTGLRIQTHLAEQADEIALVREDFPGCDDYLSVYERAGLVREGAIFAHAIHCDDGAFQRLAAAGAAIACCPTSNAFLRSGAFPLARARAAGVTIGIGSDVGGGPQFSPLDVLRHLAYLDSVPPAELLYRATLAGAEALGFAGETGCLAPGQAADLVVLEPPPDAAGDPLERFTQCVFRQPETRVVATLVEGRLVHGALPAARRD